jgi:hypothetical protein
MLAKTLDVAGEFRVGDILRRSWSIFWANFPFFVAVGGVAYVPSFCLWQNEATVSGHQWTGLGLEEDQAIEFPVTALFWTALSQFSFVALHLFVFSFFNTFGQAIVYVAVVRKQNGLSVQVTDALRQVVRRGAPLFGLATLYSLAVTVGYLLLFVPGLVLVTLWSVSVAACALEGIGPTRSLARSQSLTRGYRMKILGVMLLVMTVGLLIGWVVWFILEPVGSWATSIGDLCVQAIWIAYSSCLSVMIYQGLRVAKEGADSQHIAGVFD